MQRELSLLQRRWEWQYGVYQPVSTCLNSPLSQILTNIFFSFYRMLLRKYWDLFLSSSWLWESALLPFRITDVGCRGEQQELHRVPICFKGCYASVLCRACPNGLFSLSSALAANSGVVWDSAIVSDCTTIMAVF